MAAGWAKGGIAEMKSELDNWSDANGGWLEAPHYAMVSFDQILSVFTMAHNAGFNEYIHDPKVKKVADWFSKISTPPDSRTQGHRHLPPLGNTYIGEKTGEFGILAFLWKDKDPQFASEMQWMFRQHGSYRDAGTGGSYPGFAGYRALMIDPAISEKAPGYESEIFPRTNVVLRSNFPSDRETQLILLAGSFDGYRSHWDDDSGSITLWGKGRIIADDFGYYGAAPAEDHSMLDSPEVRQVPIFNVKEFATSKHFDYVGGARGPWQRQIAFMKDKEPLAPNYFVVCDSARTAKPGTLRLWLTAKKVAVSDKSALVEGKDDVDTEVFFAAPGLFTIRTEEKTRTSGAGISPDGKEGPTKTTQTGLVADMPADGTLTYAIYPRLKTEKPPAITALADGKAVMVRSDAGTDYVFLSTVTFSYQKDGISFKGKSGAIRLRGKQMVLSLGEGGSIAAFGHSLESGKAASKEASLAE
jgi:hypothetical protein